MPDKLIRLAKLLSKFAPDECITSIEVSKTVPGYRPNPSVTIAHFKPGVPVESYECVSSSREKIDGVEVTRRFFDKKSD